MSTLSSGVFERQYATEKRRRGLWLGVARTWAGLSPRWRRIGWAVVGLCAVTVCGLVGFPRLLDAVAQQARDQFHGQNILIVGLDTPKPHQDEIRSDVLAVVHIDEGTPALTILSITRDTRALLPNCGLQKINAGYMAGGVPLVQQLVTDYCGLPIHHHVVVDFDSFEKLIDMVGGVEVVIDAPMQYTDRAGGLRIDLEPGQQKLDGSAALTYVRWRQGDIDRIARQQKFGRQLLVAVFSPRNVARIPELSRQCVSTIRTDLTAAQVTKLLLLAKTIPADEVEFLRLKGHHEVTGDWLYVVSEEEKDAVLGAIRPSPEGPPPDLAGLSATELRNRAVRARTSGETASAYRYLAALLERHPQSPDGLESAWELSSLLVAQDRVDEAITAVEQLLDARENTEARGQIQELLGHLYLAAYRYEEAMAAWRTAIAAAQDEEAASAIVTRTLDVFKPVLKRHLSGLAIRMWPATQQLPEDLKLMLTGLDARHREQTDAATEAFEQLVTEHTDSIFVPQALVERGDIAREAGCPYEALSFYLRVRDDHPLYHEAVARALLHSGYAWAKVEKWDRAAVACDRARSLWVTPRLVDAAEHFMRFCHEHVVELARSQLVAPNHEYVARLTEGLGPSYSFVEANDVLLVASSLRESGRCEEGVALLHAAHQLQDLKPDEIARLRLHEGYALARDERWVSASERYQQALSDNKASLALRTSALVHLVRALLQRDEEQEAIATILKWRAVFLAPPDYYQHDIDPTWVSYMTIEMADVLRQAGKTSEAATLYRSILQHDHVTIPAQQAQQRLMAIQRETGGREEDYLLMKPGFDRLEPETIHLGARQGEALSAKLLVRGNTTFSVLEVVCTLGGIRAKVETENTGEHGNTIRIRIAGVPGAEWQCGESRGSLKVLTNDEQHACIVVPIVVSVSPAIEMYPDRLFFGVVSPDSTATASLTLRGGQAFDITVDQPSRPEMITVDAEKRGDSTWALVVNLRTPAEVGVVEGIVVLRTTLQAQPRLEVHYYAQVAEARDE